MTDTRCSRGGLLKFLHLLTACTVLSGPPPRPPQAAGEPSHSFISLLNVVSALLEKGVQFRLANTPSARGPAAAVPPACEEQPTPGAGSCPRARFLEEPRTLWLTGAASPAELNCPRGFDFCALIFFSSPSTTVFQNHWESESPLPAGDLGWHPAVGRARKERTLSRVSRRGGRGGAGGRLAVRTQRRTHVLLTARRAPRQPSPARPAWWPRAPRPLPLGSGLGPPRARLLLGLGPPPRGVEGPGGQRVGDTVDPRVQGGVRSVNGRALSFTESQKSSSCKTRHKTRSDAGSFAATGRPPSSTRTPSGQLDFLALGG